MNREHETGRRTEQDIRAEMESALFAVHRLRLRALEGGTWSTDEFDAAILRYRRLEQDLRAVQAAARAMPVPMPVPPTPAAVEPAPPPLAVTKRLQFARYLVQTGRLTDWPTGR